MKAQKQYTKFIKSQWNKTQPNEELYLGAFKRSTMELFVENN